MATINLFTNTLFGEHFFYYSWTECWPPSLDQYQQEKLAIRPHPLWRSSTLTLDLALSAINRNQWFPIIKHQHGPLITKYSSSVFTMDWLPLRITINHCLPIVDHQMDIFVYNSLKPDTLAWRFSGSLPNIPSIENCKGRSPARDLVLEPTKSWVLTASKAMTDLPKGAITRYINYSQVYNQVYIYIFYIYRLGFRMVPEFTLKPESDPNRSAVAKSHPDLLRPSPISVRLLDPPDDAVFLLRPRSKGVHHWEISFIHIQDQVH